MSNYYSPEGGLPAQTALLTDRAVVKAAYTVIPRGVLRDIVTSNLPGWENTRAWILARPIAGFATTFAQYIVEVAPGGCSAKPEPEAGVESVLFLTRGTLTLTLDGTEHTLEPGAYVYTAAGARWSVRNDGDEPATFQWVRKAYEPLEGYTATSFVTSDAAVTPSAMPDTDNRWSTTRFVDPNDLAHDMHVNIVTFEPGAVIPFAETHVMEHGIFVLEGKAVYRLNDDWVEVEAGDFMWLRAFCPQACYAGGPGQFRYLLYKDVNRQIRLT
ncbi:(S)-ureidoglycine aminohydrolase [Cryobacterium sp. Sr8]|uniref:bifunctional allantoicase/(S)-ureidoglycine aminohydrolase n=1 Tax=unclassified Cryobacterium TaxID=2649013 RepID=UPI00106B71FD|nr:MULTISPECIES: bifunctional allantoicase/(S)-ureidoglycine aminohydrolase [unclassified Cryobacterium]TFD41996.1 (S)-ureidoglycine aminohydrolase [Cryobacterium sp. TMT1-2-1]TFD76405.1 (S)-ureidoglycine aminohydrolase [Cryobacterium sp. Sr8]